MKGLFTARQAATALALAALAGTAGATDEAGRKLFTSAVPACALCHTLKDAGAQGAVGPILDELKPDADRVARALRNGIGAMPSYRASLSEEQIQAIARYVARAAALP